MADDADCFDQIWDRQVDGKVNTLLVASPTIVYNAKDNPQGYGDAVCAYMIDPQKYVPYDLLASAAKDFA